MAEINEDNPTGVNCDKKENGVNGFDINEATENATIVQSSENPYYAGMDGIELEAIGVNDEIEETDIIQKTENPYYGDIEDINIEETNSNSAIESATLIQKTENPYYVKLDDDDIRGIVTKD